MASRFVSTIHFSSGKKLVSSENVNRIIRNQIERIEDREFPIVFIIPEDGNGAICVNLKAIDYIEVKKVEE